jgi:transposase InsO family protein
MWIADITRFITLDDVKHYIYLVMDNYSRQIIAWDIALTANPKTRLQTFINAITFAKNSFTNIKNIELLVDGGIENCNTTVDSYLAKLKTIIHKNIALKDTTYSNSAIEAINNTDWNFVTDQFFVPQIVLNKITIGIYHCKIWSATQITLVKILKNAYLNTMQIQNGEQLRAIVAQIIKEYNQLRPHGSLHRLTPCEAYLGLQHTAIIIKNPILAKASRIAGNKTNCGIC